MTIDVIAIDGLAGSGKSSTAIVIAQKLGYGYINSGAIYRCVGLLFQQAPKGKSKVMAVLQQNPIKIISDPSNFMILCNGHNVTSKLREPKISLLASNLATKPYIRDYINDLIRCHVKETQQNMVIEGRDVGTVIFPKARRKFFFVATLGIRTRRHGKEASITCKEHLKQIETQISQRDQQDLTRKKSPLIKASDSILIDTSHFSFEQQVNHILNFIPSLNGK